MKKLEFFSGMVTAVATIPEDVYSEQMATEKSETIEADSNDILPQIPNAPAKPKKMDSKQWLDNL